MPGPGLPVNVDTTYADSGTDASVKTHQQHHDAIHAIVNKIDTANPSTIGHVLTWDGAIYAPAAPAPTTTTAAITDWVTQIRKTDCVIAYTGTQPLRTTGTTDTLRPVRWRTASTPSTAAGYALPIDVWEVTP